MKTVSKVEPSENASFWKLSVSSVDRWKRVEKTSYTVVLISVFGRFSVDDRRNRIKKNR